MKNVQLPLDAGDSQTSTVGKTKYRVEHLGYEETRASTKNPRFEVAFSDESVGGLTDEIRANGQANAAIGEVGPDGVIELLAGLRRREVCRILGRPLKVHVYDGLTFEQALSMAHREDRGSVAVSLWDRSASWQRTLNGGEVINETKLAGLVGEDKSTINRGLALQKAPAAVINLFVDKQAITSNQWFKLAPLLENKDTRERIMTCAATLAGQALGVPAVVTKLAAAAAGKMEIKATEVLNRHGKVIGTITPDHKGGFTIRVKSMIELHPTYRVDYAKLFLTAFLEILKNWFNDA